MKVALDATPLAEPTGGIRRYTEELQRALRERFPEDEFLLVTDRHCPGAQRVDSRRYWLHGLPRFLKQGGFDLFHGTDFAVPYVPARPSVLTLHDLSPWKAEYRADTSARVRRRTPILLRMGIPAMVITPSEAIRREAIAYFSLPPEEVAAVPEGVSAAFRPLDLPPVAPYFLYIGTLEPRKNLGVLTGHGLAAEVLLGGRIRKGYQLPAEPGVRLLGQTPEADLPRLYSQAVAVVYPSLYEGFGLPVLEAMACGAPVITSGDPALLELSGGACLHCDARDPAAWRDAMHAVLTRPELRKELSARSLRRARLFTWTRTAELTRDVYCAALRRFHG